MKSILLTNILLIVVLVLLGFKIVWDYSYASNVAEVRQGNDEKTLSFFGTKKLAEKLVK